MSTIAEDAQRKPSKRLSEPQRRAIVAHYTTVGSILQTAQHFGVHRNTVSTLVKSVRQLGKDSVLSADWRREFAEELPPIAVKAVRRSMEDTEDIHKAAVTAGVYLKGTGIYAPDQGQVNVLTMLAAMPADVQALIAAESTPAPGPQDVVLDCTNNGAPGAKPNAVNES